MPHRRARYGRYLDGADPLAPPFDIASAMDELGDHVLAGEGPTDALRELLRRGMPGRDGLDALARKVRRRQRTLRERGRLDGTLDDIRGLLEDALDAERRELFPDPSDDARFREAQLDQLPDDTSRAVRELAGYDWRSQAARESYGQIRALLQQEVLSQQFAGMRDALAATPHDPEAQARIKEMLSDLNDLLDKRAAGTDTEDDFDEFMSRHGEMFPDNPETLDDLLEELARRAAAAERLLRSLPPEQQQELAELMQQTMRDLGLDSEMARLQDNLRGLRPDLFRPGREQMTGDRPLGLADATEALAELADLEAVKEQLGQSYAGASIDDVDEELVRRALGRAAVDDLDQLRAIQRELEDQGYLVRRNGDLELTPKAVRRLGLTALRRVFADLQESQRGGHDIRSAGASGELTGSTRGWQFGDEQPLDVVRTVGNAVRRGSNDGAVRLTVDDFEVVETERRSAAAVCLLVDTSYSMVVNGTWGDAKQTALALHSLISMMYPQDALEIIGFSEYARVLQPHELAALDFAMVQGTNLQHALLLAGRFVDRHPGYDPVVLLVTDGEPTAHLHRDGSAMFSWPPEPETIALTVAEVDKMTRRHATLNVFMLGEDPRLRAFVDDVAKRNGGRVFAPSSDRLGEYVVRDFLDRRSTLR
jgi:uncharacterized protein with von Willebrand factor type A (vWA) domain